MSVECEVEFENSPSKVVSSGTLLIGNVKLRVNKKLFVKEIYIALIGSVEVHWAQGNTAYSGNKDFLYELCSHYHENPEVVWLTPDVGTYNYPFQQLMSTQLPSSFIGKYGKIEYRMCVLVKIKGGREKKFKVPFTVFKPFDLNADQSLRRPVEVERIQKIYPCALLCCFKSKPLEIVGRIQSGGYVPGQIINLNFNVSNKCDRPVTEFVVRLIREVRYGGEVNDFLFGKDDVSHIESETIAETKVHGCDIGADEEINVALKVPWIKPTDLSGIYILVQYFCVIKGKIEGYIDRAYVKLPITIGTYPFTGLGVEEMLSASDLSYLEALTTMSLPSLSKYLK